MLSDEELISIGTRLDVAFHVEGTQPQHSRDTSWIRCFYLKPDAWPVRGRDSVDAVFLAPSAIKDYEDAGRGNVERLGRLACREIVGEGLNPHGTPDPPPCSCACAVFRILPRRADALPHY